MTGAGGQSSYSISCCRGNTITYTALIHTHTHTHAQSKTLRNENIVFLCVCVSGRLWIVTWVLCLFAFVCVFSIEMYFAFFKSFKSVETGPTANSFLFFFIIHQIHSTSMQPEENNSIEKTKSKFNSSVKLLFKFVLP